MAPATIKKMAKTTNASTILGSKAIDPLIMLCTFSQAADIWMFMNPLVYSSLEMVVKSPAINSV
jgi:hypothetical protein